MKIEIITLPEATARHKELETAFKKHNLNYELVSGVKPNDCNFYYEKNTLFCDVKNTKIHVNENKISKVFWPSSIAVFGPSTPKFHE